MKGLELQPTQPTQLNFSAASPWTQTGARSLVACSLSLVWLPKAESLASSAGDCGSAGTHCLNPRGPPTPEGLVNQGNCSVSQPGPTTPPPPGSPPIVVRRLSSRRGGVGRGPFQEVPRWASTARVPPGPGQWGRSGFDHGDIAAVPGVPGSARGPLALQQSAYSTVTCPTLPL